MENKKWYQSKTIWGILIGALGFVTSQVLGVPDVVLPENADFDQIKSYVEAVKEAKGSVEVLASQLVAAFGGLLAIYGRIKADTKIS
jgi:hypothetical protein